jgi:hypothetical protein
MKIYAVTAFLVLMLLGGVDQAGAMRELSDNELDSVTAGLTISSELIDAGIRFDFHKDNGRNLSIDGSGSVAVSEAPLPQTTGALVLRDNAQGNLNAFINVNAVNSVLNFLINLNVNINSTVGTVSQRNQFQGL